MRIKKIIVVLFLFLVFIGSYSYYKSWQVKESAFINSKIDKSLFKNKLLDEVIATFQNIFYKTNYDISSFSHKELDSKFYFYSQIFDYPEAYFMIEYDEFEVKKLELNFSNTSDENIADVVELMALLIQVSDEDIVKKEAKRIVINIMKQLEEDTFQRV